MIEKHFEFIIASSPDREKVTCEIYYKGEELCEISQETSELLLDIYKPMLKKSWTVPLNDFQHALSTAKKYLLSGERADKNT